MNGGVGLGKDGGFEGLATEPKNVTVKASPPLLTTLLFPDR